jgi:hypothetical protein
MTFEHDGRTYTVDRIYSFNGELRIECHYYSDLARNQGIGRTWRLADLELPHTAKDWLNLKLGLNRALFLHRRNQP